MAGLLRYKKREMVAHMVVPPPEHVFNGLAVCAHAHHKPAVDSEAQTGIDKWISDLNAYITDGKLPKGRK